MQIAHVPVPQLTLTLGAMMTAVMAIVVRMRATDKPVNAKKLLLPPVGMSTGFLMFVVPAMRIPLLWGIVAFAAGALLFAYPLIRFSKLERRGAEVFLVRSKAFIFILVGLLAVRLLLRGVIEQYVTLPQTGAVFFVVAFGMLLPWRLAMYRKFRRLLAASPQM
ncbi:CcdC family protein [Paenibacillus sp. TAB 01]|uniref:CcdC family protein n=1 Tax=Paenibacillus sp. TAB 01 TaxID=3368988 RepID=UPI00375062D9